MPGGCIYVSCLSLFPLNVLPESHSHFIPPTLSLLPSPSGSSVVQLAGWSMSERLVFTYFSLIIDTSFGVDR